MEIPNNVNCLAQNYLKMKFFLFSFTFLALCIQASGENDDYQKYAMFAQNAERAKPAQPIKTELPLKLSKVPVLH